MIKLFLSVLLLFSLKTFALEVPFLTGRVVDNAHIIDSRTEMTIDSMLKSHEKQTTNQIVVLTIPNLQGDVLEEYSLKVVEKWKLGQKGQDNGVLLLIAKDDRKLRIEVGYGLEGKLTDAYSGRIIQNIIVPYFKSGDYSKGIHQGVTAILGTLDGKYTPPQKSRRRSKKDYSGTLFLIIWLLIVIFGRKRGSHVFLGGSSFGGGGGGFSGGGGSFGGGGSSGSW